MNTKLAYMFSRRSVRKYQNKEVLEDVVRDLLEAAMAAPSACCKDPWHFVAVKDRKTLSEIAQGLPYGKMLGSAGVGIIVCGSLKEAHDNQISYMLQDCSAAIQNILLAANTLGLGGCWLGVHPREDRMEHIRKVLKIPPDIIPLAALAIGWPDEKHEARTRYAEAKLHRNKW
jgi:nitroreductase